MEYVTTTIFRDIPLPIYLDDLESSWATLTNRYSHNNATMQLILDINLVYKDDDFIKYVINHELGHFHLYLKYMKGELPFKPVGSFKEELYCDIYSLQTIDEYNLDFIDYLSKQEENSPQQKLLLRYMRKILKRNLKIDLDDILKINFENIL